MASGNNQGYNTRGVVFTLDPTLAQERLLRSYAGAARFAYNWAITRVSENLALRQVERAAGVPEAELNPVFSWSAYSLGKAWNEAKAEVAPWWAEVSMHAFRSGTAAVASALANFSASRKGERRGRPVGFPRHKSRRHSTPSISFVEINHQLSWLHPSRHGVRLMLPQSSPEPDIRRRRSQLEWIHTVESTRRLYRLVESGRATIQRVTISYRGGRWQAAFSVRYAVAPGPRPPLRAAARRTVGLDAGLRHLATLSVPVRGLTDPEGHIANPAVLARHLAHLKKLDRALERCERGSNNRARLCRRRARLHGRIAKTRALEMHRVTGELVRRFGAIGIEDLNVAGMGRRKGHLGQSVSDAALGELRRQLTYKCADAGNALVVIDRFYPSSKTCPSCGAVKAKLDRAARVFCCQQCGFTIDRDVGAARNIGREAERLLGQNYRGIRRRATTGDTKRRPEAASDRASSGSPGSGRLRAEPSSTASTR
ncbi:MAG TPA: RNA-guided endonuclease TnpB family protein [Acidimicrobiales bacterium]|nr:RNA-guided endonuclease TnpB family protein [Acidimicrobiales bacterium]